MTIPGLGKLTPVQLDMIELSGCLIREFEPDDDQRQFFKIERLWRMKAARKNLVRTTGQDFRYDLAQWHDFLSSSEENFGYTHPYGWSQTRHIITNRIANPDRMRLAKLAEELTDEIGWDHCRAPSRDKLRPQIRVMLANLRSEIPVTDTDKYVDAKSARSILAAMTGIDCGSDPDLWESILVTDNTA